MLDPSQERMIDDLDVEKFVYYFLYPQKAADLVQPISDQLVTPKYEAKKIFQELINESLKYMAEQLVIPKYGQTIDAYRQTIQELTTKPGSRQTVENFVINNYYLLFWLGERKKIAGSYFPWSSRNSVKKLTRIDYQILRSFYNSIEATQEIESDSSILLKLKKFGSTVSQDENYQASKGMVHDMENYGEGKLNIRYDYFETVKGVQHIKFDTKERWKEMLDWFFHKTKTALKRTITLGEAYYYTSLRERLHTKALEFLIGQNADSIGETLGYGKPMGFFLGATQFIEKMKSSKIPLTYPSFNKEKGFMIKELYNPLLLLQRHIVNKDDIVPNDVLSNPEQNVAIITGPNNTGKSIYVKSIGLAYVLAQNGFPIPAVDAQLSETDAIYTHFVHPEDIRKGEGSYLDELRRIKELLQKATPRSLLIVDEPIRGTSPEDTKVMSLRFIKGFLRLKAPTFLTTHYHGVATEVGNWDGIRNLRTEIMVDGNEIQPTYKIVLGKAGKSYGTEIADQFGLGEEDILKMIEEKLDKK